MKAAKRGRVVRGPQLDAVMYVAQGTAVTVVLASVILALHDADVVDAQEVAALLMTEPPIHADPLAEAMARGMIDGLAQMLIGPAEEEG
jgi:hypothetical protein